MDDVGEVTGEGNNDEPSSTATSPTSPTSSSPQSTSISATSTTATATSTPRSTTTVARRLQRRRRDRRERRGTVVDDSDGALVGTMESAETPIPRTKVFSSWARKKMVSSLARTRMKEGSGSNFICAGPIWVMRVAVDQISVRADLIPAFRDPRPVLIFTADPFSTPF